MILLLSQDKNYSLVLFLQVLILMGRLSDTPSETVITEAWHLIATVLTHLIQVLTSTTSPSLRNDMSLLFFATDNDGINSRTRSKTTTVKGNNDAPVVSIGTGDSDSASLTETEAALSTSGTLTVNDADLSDNVSLTTSVAASGTTTGIEFDNSQLAALFTVNSGSISADPSGVSNISWAFDAGTDTFDYLADGESLTLTYTITVTDDASATATQDVTITIDGTNDAPILNLNTIYASTNNYSFTFTEGDPTTAILTHTSDISLTDIDSNSFNMIAVGLQKSKFEDGASESQH